MQYYASFASALLYAFLVSAFVFLCPVITAYSEVIGWVALRLAIAFGLGGFIAILVQSPFFVGDQDASVRGKD